jgi:hypothetical protein
MWHYLWFFFHYHFLGSLTSQAISQVWWHTPVIPVLGSLKQKDWQFETKMGYIARTRAKKKNHVLNDLFLLGDRCHSISYAINLTFLLFWAATDTERMYCVSGKGRLYSADEKYLWSEWCIRRNCALELIKFFL